MRGLLFTLLLALSGVRALGAVQEDPSGLGRAPLDIVALAERDARISFSPDGTRRARATLDSTPEAVEDRAVAALALASARATGDLPRLESMVAVGLPLEQRAALFALGEMGTTGWGSLDAASRDAPVTLPGAGLADALAVALVAAERGGAPGRARLEELARGADERAVAAREALAILSGGTPRALTVAIAQRYELRWRAAQDYGLVDGRLWRRTQTREWFADEEFLDRVVLAAAAELPGVELRTHLYEMLLAGERPGVLRVAAFVMPDELVHAYRSGAWVPTVDGWRAMLEEIDARRAEKETRALVELAFETAPELEPLAGLLLLRAGGEIPWRWVADRLANGTDAERTRLVEAVGDRGEAARVPELAELLTLRPDLGLEAPGLVALARLGHPPAVAALGGVVREPASEERDAVLAALARVLRDRSLRPFAETALARDDVPIELRLDLELGLALSAERVDRDLLRRTLPFAARQPGRLDVVRALGDRPSEEDLGALAGIFPSETDAALNVEIALVLLEHRHPAVKGCLAAALWGDAWNRSVLAGGLVYRIAGLRGLVEELGAPPRTATERDLRRVGFALGEWGGLAAVEELSRTHREGDPALQGALLGALASRASRAGEMEEAAARARLRITPSRVTLPGLGASPDPGAGGGAAGGKRRPGFPGKKRRPGGR